MEHSHTHSFVLSKSCVASKIICPTKSQILSPPSEKEFVDFCSGWYFLPDKIYFCFWQAGGVPTMSSCLNPGKGLTVTARARLFPVPSVLLLGCHPLGSQFKTDLPGLPFLAGQEYLFLSLSPWEAFKLSSSSASQLHFPWFADTSLIATSHLQPYSTKIHYIKQYIT